MSDPCRDIFPCFLLIPKEKKDPRSWKGIAAQNKFTARVSQGFRPALPVLNAQGIGFAEIQEWFARSEGLVLFFSLPFLLLGDFFLQPLFFLRKKTINVSLRCAVWHLDQHGPIPFNLDGKCFFSSPAPD